MYDVTLLFCNYRAFKAYSGILSAKNRKTQNTQTKIILNLKHKKSQIPSRSPTMAVVSNRTSYSASTGSTTVDCFQIVTIRVRSAIACVLLVLNLSKGILS